MAWLLAFTFLHKTLVGPECLHDLAYAVLLFGRSFCSILFQTEIKLWPREKQSRMQPAATACSELERTLCYRRELSKYPFFLVNFTVLFLNLHVHLPAALHLVIIFLLSRWMYREQREFSSISVKGLLFSDQVSSVPSVGLRIN